MKFVREVVKIIAPFLKSKGFTLSGRNFYYVNNDIAYCIALDAPSGLLYVTSYIMPLYVPCETRYYTYGNRIHMLKNISLTPLHKDDSVAYRQEWCDALCECIDGSILPFYKKIASPELLMKQIEFNKHRTLKYFFCSDSDIARLSVFSYLYLADYARLNKSLEQYREILLTNTFFTDTVRCKFLDEIETVKELSRDDLNHTTQYLQSIMDNTRRILQ